MITLVSLVQTAKLVATPFACLPAAASLTNTASTWPDSNNLHIVYMYCTLHERQWFGLPTPRTRWWPL
jgi:hypothetical protein